MIYHRLYILRVENIMKRKRLDRDIWWVHNQVEFPRYYQMRVEIEEFHGLVCLLQLIDGEYHYSVSIWYTDVIENIEYDSDGVAVFIDKYLDVVFTPQGDVVIDDRDELDAALQSGDISKEQYDSALKESNVIVEEYCSDIIKTELLCYKILNNIYEKINKEVKEFEKKKM